MAATLGLRVRHEVTEAADSHPRGQTFVECKKKRDLIQTMVLFSNCGDQNSTSVVVIFGEIQKLSLKWVIYICMRVSTVKEATMLADG